MSASKETGRKIAKYFLFGICGVFLLLLISCAISSGLYEDSVKAEPITELSHYRNERLPGWVIDEPYAVFPEEYTIFQANDWEYLFKREFSLMPLLFDNDVVCYLRCVYTPQCYASETERLSSLCGVPNTTRYSFPAYVFDSGGRHAQYALIDDESCTIYYLSLQNRAFAEQYVDAALLP